MAAPADKIKLFVFQGPEDYTAFIVAAESAVNGFIGTLPAGTSVKGISISAYSIPYNSIPPITPYPLANRWYVIMVHYS